MNAGLKRRVRQRARGRCEYCQVPVHIEPFRPHIDHIVSRKHGGRTVISNLAFSCAHCNSHKGSDVSGIDPVTGLIVQLFNPRTHAWDECFLWKGPIVAGRTAQARATIRVLRINAPRRIELRAALIEEGIFWPAEDQRHAKPKRRL